MQITGIIAEYNPFHNGHAFQLARARKETGADYIIVIMSGNFVQRGAPALLDKFVRAEMALLEGADLVVELPPIWSCASAEYFAAAGIRLLYQLGCVNTLCYGCETPSLDIYTKLCAILIDETPQYQQLLARSLKSGCGFARARENALLSLLSDADAAAAAQILKNPNNILALEYLKAIAKESADKKTSQMHVHPILRQGQGYHSDLLHDSLASASAIRRFLANDPAADVRILQQVLPAASCRLLLDYRKRHPFLYENDCSQMLHYCLIKNAAAGFSQYADCTPQLSRRICRNLKDYNGFTNFCTQIKSKNIAYTRISRVLLHILLDIRQDSYTYWQNRSYVPYARMLGFRKESKELLTHLKKTSSIPLLSRAADAEKILPDADAVSFFHQHLFADAVYRALALEKGGCHIRQEYEQPVRIV